MKFAKNTAAEAQNRQLPPFFFPLCPKSVASRASRISSGGVSIRTVFRTRTPCLSPALNSSSFHIFIKLAAIVGSSPPSYRLPSEPTRGDTASNKVICARQDSAPVWSWSMLGTAFVKVNNKYESRKLSGSFCNHSSLCSDYDFRYVRRQSLLAPGMPPHRKPQLFAIATKLRITRVA